MAVSNQHVEYVLTGREYRSKGLFDSEVEVKIGGFWRVFFFLFPVISKSLSMCFPSHSCALIHALKLENNSHSSQAQQSLYVGFFFFFYIRNRVAPL